jgi:Na+-transporting methylmalonyl-CoA/oxaloacetate decarboxylase beta subunit
MKGKLLLFGNIFGAIIAFIYIVFLKEYFSSIVKVLYESINEASASQPDASSIGTIGGADGPTAFFVTSPNAFDSTYFLLFPLILINVVFMANIIFLYKNHK